MKAILAISRYGISVLLITITAGCATEYGCKGMPDEPSCLSTTQAYQVTNTALPETPAENSQGSESVSKPTLVPPLQQPVPKIEDPTRFVHPPRSCAFGSPLGKMLTAI